MALSSFLFFSLCVSRAWSMPGPPLHVYPRDHLECDSNGWHCSIVPRCDNDPSQIAGAPPYSPTSTSSTSQSPSSMAAIRTIRLGTSNSVPLVTATGSSSSPTGSPSTSSGAIVAANSNPISGALVSRPSSEVSAVTTSAVVKMARQILNPATIQWCKLGTTFFVLIQELGNPSDLIRTMVGQTKAQLATSLGPNENDTIPAATNPILSFSGPRGNRIDLYNDPSHSLTWFEASLGINLTDGWMTSVAYKPVHSEITDGSSTYGHFQFSVPT